MLVWLWQNLFTGIRQMERRNTNTNKPKHKREHNNDETREHGHMEQGKMGKVKKEGAKHKGAKSGGGMKSWKKRRGRKQKRPCNENQRRKEEPGATGPREQNRQVIKEATGEVLWTRSELRESKRAKRERESEGQKQKVRNIVATMIFLFERAVSCLCTRDFVFGSREFVCTGLERFWDPAWGSHPRQFVGTQEMPLVFAHKCCREIL